MAECVWPAPYQAERAQPALVEDLERVQVGIDRLRALDMKDRREYVAFEAAPKSARGSHDLEPAVGGPLVPEQACGEQLREPLGARQARRRRHRQLVAVRRGRSARSRGFARWREHREEPAGEAAVPRPRQIEVTDRGALEQAVRALRITHECQQGVIVPIEDR